MEPLKITSKVLVLTLNLEPGDVSFLDELKEGKKLALVAEVPKGSTLVGCVPTPTVLDMVGFSSPSGPPTFVFVAPVCEEKEVRIFVVGEHDTLMQVAGQMVDIIPICTLLVVNVPTVIFEIREVQEGTGVNVATLDQTCGALKSSGVTPVVLQPYKPPLELMAKLMKMRGKHV